MTGHRRGIPAARDARGAVWPREAIDADPRPFVAPLNCGQCSAAVSAVGEYTKRSEGGLTITVAAHYRLTSGGEHETGCPYDFDRRAQGVVADSMGTVVKQRDHWRLLLPTDVDMDVHEATGVRSGEPPRRKLQVTPSSVLLTPAINSAAKIARLLETFERDPGLVELFRAEYGERLLRWEDFAYGPSDYPRLLDRLTAGPLEHPVAVYGRTHKLGTSRNGLTYALHARGRIRMASRESPSWVPVVVRADDEALLPREDAMHWLAYGFWSFLHTDSGYREIQLWLRAPWQITTWQPDQPDP